MAYTEMFSQFIYIAWAWADSEMFYKRATEICLGGNAHKSIIYTHKAYTGIHTTGITYIGGVGEGRWVLKTP